MSTITKEALELSRQYWEARLAETQKEFEELLLDQEEALSEDYSIDMSRKIINASDRIDVAESVLSKLNNLK
jgi:hypothetical protein